MMKIRVESYGDTDRYDSILDYASYALNGDDYGKGAVEAVTCTAENSSEAIGRLLDVLAAKGLVTAEEVGTILEGFCNPDSIEFEN